MNNGLLYETIGIPFFFFNNREMVKKKGQNSGLNSNSR